VGQRFDAESRHTRILTDVDGIELLKRDALTRLTNAHSKSLRHHTAMQALFVAWYNLCRKHEALKGATRAMASGLSDHVWTIKELIARVAE
jgi:hypothetical protein